jgi:hypothetical protein
MGPESPDQIRLYEQQHLVYLLVAMFGGINNPLILLCIVKWGHLLQGYSGRSVKMTFHFVIIPRLITLSDIPLLPSRYLHSVEFD